MKATYQHPAAGKQSLFRPCLLMLLVLFCSLPGWSNKQENIKKKEINKSPTQKLGTDTPRKVIPRTR